jgi:hypothetical protein
MNMIDQLRAILGDDLEKIKGTRLNRMDELEALIALYQEFGERPVKLVIENALTTYRDWGGKLRHLEKVSAIEALEGYRRSAKVDAECAEYVRQTGEGGQ